MLSLILRHRRTLHHGHQLALWHFLPVSQRRIILYVIALISFLLCKLLRRLILVLLLDVHILIIHSLKICRLICVWCHDLEHARRIDLCLDVGTGLPLLAAAFLCHFYLAPIQIVGSAQLPIGLMEESLIHERPQRLIFL